MNRKMALEGESTQADSEQKKAKETPTPSDSLGLRFSTKHDEQTGLLHVSDLGLELFSSGPENERLYYTRSDDKPKPDDESGWEGQQSSQVYFSESVDVSSLRSGTPVHVLFHFHDNYCDSCYGFLDLDEAKLAFQNLEDEMWDQIETNRQRNDDYHFCMVKHDKWHCDLLECTTGGWERPDKGDTWWLRSSVID
jgi:hypothetical protein